MDDIQSRKRLKRCRRNQPNGGRENPQAKTYSRNAGRSLISCLSKTGKSFNKEIPRMQLTQGRITSRLGLFNQGKCTSFIRRGRFLSPATRARMDGDLHRIIQLANGVPIADKKYEKESGASVDPCRIPISSCSISERESVKECERSCRTWENFFWGDNHEENKVNEKNAARSLSEKLTTAGHDKMEPDPREIRSSEEKKGYHTLSASTESNDSPSCSYVEHSSSLAEYEDFSAAVILPLNEIKLGLFSQKDYLEEVRGRIKSIVHQSKNMFQLNPTDAAFEEDRMSCGSGDSLFNAQSKKSPELGQRNETESQRSSVRNELDSDELSPFPFILSPKTTILNPIEYLKRVEQACKQKEKEKTFFDSGLESGEGHGLSLSKSHGEANFSHGMQDSEPLQYSKEQSEAFIGPTQSTAEIFGTRHSNGSFIDFPQAFQVRDEKFEFPESHYTHTSVNFLRPNDNFGVRSKHSKLTQGMPSVSNSDHNVSRLQYLMDFEGIGHSSNSVHKSRDLLDELDALACDPADDSSVGSVKGLRRSSAKLGIGHSSGSLYRPRDLLDDLDELVCNHDDSNAMSRKAFRTSIPSLKRWGPPPSPPTPEHKFYRRKMF